MQIQEPGKKIKQIRELKNYTQDYIATNLGISNRAYSKIETGETNLTIDKLNSISEVLEVSPFDILGFNEKQLFTNCTQEGNIGINNIVMSDKLSDSYEKHINNLKEEIIFLRKLIK